MATSLKLVSEAILLVTLVVTIATVVYAFWEAPPALREVPELIKSPGIRVVGLISDTHAHLPFLGGELPEKVLTIFKEANVSLIIHAGDLTSLDIIEELERIAPVVAVHGNMDPPEVRAILPSLAVEVVSGWRIGVVHDIGFPPLWGMAEMERIAEEHDLDVLVFGHTHKPFLRVEGDRIFINPGSPVDPLPPLLTKRTIGLLVIAEGSIEPFIIEV